MDFRPLAWKPATLSVFDVLLLKIEDCRVVRGTMVCVWMEGLTFARTVLRVA